MRVEEIPASERDFDETGLDSENHKHTLTPRQIAIPGENSNLNYVLVQPASGTSYYYPDEHPKDQIVLHFTLGYLKGDIETLTRPNYHVSVPFLIGRNGTIYNLFYSAGWSYHLGNGAVGGNTKRSRETIGIELSNIGGLKNTGQGMTAYNNKVYCDVNQHQYYEQVSFRRYNYYATFTNAQYQSLVTLLRYLSAQYNIERKFLPDDFRYITFNDVVDFGGIVSHVNYRASGKEDIGPAFDWDRIIAGLG